MQTGDIECRLTAAPASESLRNESVLAVVSHRSVCCPTGAAGHLESGLQALEGSGTNELWYAATAAARGVDDGVYWAESDSILFAAVWLEDAEDEALVESIRQGYAQLLSFARGRGYPQLLRVWNYIRDINRGDGDTERYRLFCTGRHRALAGAGVAVGEYPAASALGHESGDNVIFLVAGRSPGRHFENPRQTSAYRYPREYGPQSPSFARATLQGSGEGGLIYLSGTASIVGHRTRHPGDLEGQLRVTLDNLDALTGSIAESLGRERVSPSVLKVYLRRAGDLDPARRLVEAHYGPDVEKLYLRADICRRELLIEIEGVCEL